MLKLCVTGGRDFNDKELISKALSPYIGQEVALAHGGAKGADNLAQQFALHAGWKVVEFPADWKLYGNRAGPIRNELMLRFFKPDILIAFPGGKGTFDCCNKASFMRIPILFIKKEDKKHDRL